MATRLNCTLHQVELALETDGAPWLAFAADYLTPLQSAPPASPSIQVTLRWDQLLPPATLEPLGRRVWSGDGRLRLTEVRPLPGLQWEVSARDDTMWVEAAYRWPTRRARWLARLSWAARARLYVSLIYYLVYFPCCWWLEWQRGWSLLHAAALASPDGGVVLSGLPGCGKSTFVWSALTLPGWQLLSDNLTLAGDGQVWACPEPIHVDHLAQQMAGGVPPGVRPTGRAFSHHREDFEPIQRLTAARPRGLAFLRRGATTRLHRLEGETAFRRLWASDLLAQEWLAYQECAAALHHVIPQIGDPERRRANLQELARLPCYEAVLQQGHVTPATVQQILETVSNGRD